MAACSATRVDFGVITCAVPIYGRHRQRVPHNQSVRYFASANPEAVVLSCLQASATTICSQVHTKRSAFFVFLLLGQRSGVNVFNRSTGFRHLQVSWEAHTPYTAPREDILGVYRLLDCAC